MLNHSDNWSIITTETATRSISSCTKYQLIIFIVMHCSNTKICEHKSEAISLEFERITLLVWAYKSFRFQTFFKARTGALNSILFGWSIYFNVWQNTLIVYMKRLKQQWKELSTHHRIGLEKNCAKMHVKRVFIEFVLKFEEIKILWKFNRKSNDKSYEDMKIITKSWI